MRTLPARAVRFLPVLLCCLVPVLAPAAGFSDSERKHGAETSGTPLRMGEWAYKVDIDVSYDRVAPLTNFPLLVVFGTNITGFSYKDVGHADGSDLRFTPTDGRSLLDYEIEEWNPAGNSYVWVRVPALESNTVIHAYWGNPGAAPHPSSANGATWDDTFMGVWHLDQTNGLSDVRDSTIRANDGAGDGGSDSVDGLLAGAHNFESASRENIVLASTPSSNFLPMAGSPISMSCWVNAESIASGDAAGNRMMTIHRRHTGPSSAVALALGNDHASVYYYGGYLISPSTLNVDTWTYVTLTYDGAELRLYVDGAFESSVAANLPAGSSNQVVRIGSYDGTSRFFDGIIDEMRVSNVPRSADWISACHESQRPANAFTAYGTAVENFDWELAGAPAATNAAPLDYSNGTATVGGVLTTGAAAHATIYWGMADGGVTPGAWGNTTSVGMVTMKAFLTDIPVGAGGDYYYRCTVTNDEGSGWTPATTHLATPLAALSIADSSIDEGQSGTGHMQFTVTPTVPCASNVTVRYRTADGTATAGNDYVAVDSVLQIPAMQPQATLTVAVKGDVDLELPDEHFYVELLDPTHATLGDGNAIGMITDDDFNGRGWRYRMKIMFDGYEGDETLRNFPVLVTFAPHPGFSYSQFASPYGYDLRFADSSGTRGLSHEIDRWDTNGTSYVWVRVPELSDTNTSIYAYWGTTSAVATVTSPTELSDCVLWLRADKGVQTNGTNVTTWLDQSGYGNDASPTGAVTQPILVDSFLNGKPVVRLDGAGDYLRVADAPSLDGTSGLTIFTVVTPRNLNGSPRGLVSKRVNSGSNQSYSQFFYGGNRLNNDIQDGSGDRFASKTVFANGQTYVTELVFDGTLPATQRSTLAVDGALDTTANESTSYIVDYSGDLHVGILNAGYGYSLGCDIAEIIIYRRALSEIEARGVGCYLANKYGLPSEYGTDAPAYTRDGSVWSEGYAGVWHLREDGETIRYDATANDNDTSLVQNDPNAVWGFIGKGNDFDGNDSLTVPDSSSLGDNTVDSMAFSLWLKSHVALSTGGEVYRALEKGDCYYLLQGRTSGGLGYGGMNFVVRHGANVLEATDLGTDLTADRWYHISATFDGTDMRLYLDGVLVDTQYVGEDLDDDNLALKIGSDDGWPARKYFDGVLDELRICNVCRSPDWVRAAYRSMADPGAFQTSGRIEYRQGGMILIVR